MKRVLCLLTISFIITSCGMDNSNSKEKVIFFSQETGFYEDQISLVLSSQLNGTIYYTLDGSEPTDHSLKYQKPITLAKSSSIKNMISDIRNITILEDTYFPNYNVDKCQAVKAIEYYEDGDKSDTFVNYYFIGVNEEHYADLPIVLLDTSYDNLFDYEEGIYVPGVTYDNAEKSDYSYPEEIPANYNNKGKEWERTALLTYFDSNHEFKLRQNVGIRIHGGWSRAFNQKSFNIYARKEYSDSKVIEEPLFGEFLTKTFMLRNGGYRDVFITKSRDTLAQTLLIESAVEVQRNFPVITFLNGEYWGIYNLQERFSDTYFEEHYGIDKDNVIIIEKDELDEGEAADINLYNEMLYYFQSEDFSTENGLDKAKNYINIESFADYMASELIIGNVDWPYNNVRMFRSREVGSHPKEDGKWRFCLYDTDDSMGIISKADYNSDPFDNIAHWKNGPLDSGCTIGLLFTALLNNQQFVEYFSNRFENLANNIFSQENIYDYLENQKSLLAKPMELFYKRFVSNNENQYNFSYFRNECDKIETFFIQRRPFVIQKMKEHLGLL